MREKILSSLAEPVARLLFERGEKVAVSESTAGGLISAALLSIPNASRYYAGGGVVYTYRAMIKFLDIDLKARSDIRSSSEPYAELAAEAIRAGFSATWGLAETGAAGPDNDQGLGNRYGDASGHSCIAVSGPVSTVMTLETGSDAREENMWRFTEQALAELEAALKKAP